MPGIEDQQDVPTGTFTIYDVLPDDAVGINTLHDFAAKGRAKEILQMSESTIDFNVNEKDRYGRTALHWAADVGQQRAVEVLLDIGADKALTDAVGRTAVHLAARGGHPGILEALLEDEPQAAVIKLVNEPDLHGITPVYLAREKGAEGEEAMKYLMSKGALYN